ncbi:hypothetical protein V8C42DRAFT_343752 [Trichoderma barbatum]
MANFALSQLQLKMSTSIVTVVNSLLSIIGVWGTGQVGRSLVKALIDAEFNVTVVTQSSGSIPKEINGAIFLTSDYTYESLVKIFTGQEAVVSAVAAGPPPHMQAATTKSA